MAGTRKETGGSLAKKTGGVPDAGQFFSGSVLPAPAQFFPFPSGRGQCSSLMATALPSVHHPRYMELGRNPKKTGTGGTRIKTGQPERKPRKKLERVRASGRQPIRNPKKTGGRLVKKLGRFAGELALEPVFFPDPLLYRLRSSPPRRGREAEGR